jgi:predicted MFS family arabinose efflux permease
VYVLAAGIFAMVTSEFAVAGLMPRLAEGLGTGIEQIGYLVTVFAIAMSAGGPILTVCLMRIRPRTALMVIFGIFLSGNVIAALATSYGVMVFARVVSGAASQAFFGIAISLCVQLVDERVRGRAVGVAMNGLTLGTCFGLPMATLVGGRLGWRAAFWAISLLTAIAAVLTVALVRDPEPESSASSKTSGSIAGDLRVFRRPRLLLALASSTLIIGATFSAFSFFTPILTQITGFAEGTIPFLLLAYGAATVIGNNIVGRLADRHTIPTLLIGTALNVVFLAGFALFTETPAIALVSMFGIGLVGVTMNPAMAVRVQRACGTRPLVNTVHSSFITLGVILSSAIGSALIPDHGLRAPIMLGIAMALLAIMAILPALSSDRRRQEGSAREESGGFGAQQRDPSRPLEHACSAGPG